MNKQKRLKLVWDICHVSIINGACFSKTKKTQSNFFHNNSFVKLTLQNWNLLIEEGEIFLIRLRFLRSREQLFMIYDCEVLLPLKH